MRLRFAAILIALCTALGPLFGLSLREVRDNALTKGRSKSIQTVRLVYRITSEAAPESTLLIRASRPNQFRLDFYAGKDHKSVCINKDGGWARIGDQEVQKLSKEDITEVEYDAAFLPFDLLDKRVYAEPKLIGKETVDDIACDVYESHGIDDEDFKIKVWIDTQSEPNHISKSETNDHGKMTVAYFSDFRDRNGVYLPGTVQMSSDDGCSTMTLRSAQWNLALETELFIMPAGAPNGPRASGITAEDRAIQNGTIIPISDQEAAKIQQQIDDLDVQINAVNDVMNRLDQGMRDNQAYEIQLANAEANSRFYYSYYRHSSWYRHRDRTLRRRAMRDMTRATSKMSRDYDKAQKDLVDLQLKRGRLKNKLKAAGREVK